MFPEKNRLKKGFYSIFKNGKRIKCRLFVVIFLENKEQDPRFAIIVSKKVGNAVLRNKIKRQIRAIIRKKYKNFNKGFDIIIMPSKFIDNWNKVSFSEIEQSLIEQLNKI